jgi:prepilin-type N-terminal cleavage/methylation domain-containing protein
MGQNNRNIGFTLVELIMVIVISGVLVAVAASGLIDLSSDAKISVLHSLRGQFKSTTDLVPIKARLKGLTAVNTNPIGPVTLNPDRLHKKAAYKRSPRFIISNKNNV